MFEYNLYGVGSQDHSHNDTRSDYLMILQKLIGR